MLARGRGNAFPDFLQTARLDLRRGRHFAGKVEKPAMTIARHLSTH
jgi:hypothetical protein